MTKSIENLTKDKDAIKVMFTGIVQWQIQKF